MREEKEFQPGEAQEQRCRCRPEGVGAVVAEEKVGLTFYETVATWIVGSCGGAAREMLLL
jgi:hypothetical protein